MTQHRRGWGEQEYRVERRVVQLAESPEGDSVSEVVEERKSLLHKEIYPKIVHLMPTCSIEKRIIRLLSWYHISYI